MGKGLKILRVGCLGVASSRFLDLLEDKRLEKLLVVDWGFNARFVNELCSSARFFGVKELLKKFEFVPIEGSRVINAGLRLAKYCKVCSVAISSKILSLPGVKSFKPDFVWFGDNDFDGSNGLFFVLHRSPLRHFAFVRSYKETRYVCKWDEFYMLQNADFFIFPTHEYTDFFLSLYGLKITNYLCADLDWRYSKLVEWIKSLQVDKFSSRDREPHVCILTGRALCTPSEARSGHRYCYIPLIQELITRRVHVHLHAFKIVPSRKYGNLYEKIAGSNAYFHIERPLNLQPGSTDYGILKRYDAGILHPPVPEWDIKLYNFQRLNVPNRLFEYQMADVLPLVQKGALSSVEQIIKDTSFGVIYNNIDELTDALYANVASGRYPTMSRNRIKTYKDFVDKLFLAFNLVSERSYFKEG